MLGQENLRADVLGNDSREGLLLANKNIKDFRFRISFGRAFLNFI